MSDVVVRCSGISRTYQEESVPVQALQDVDFEVCKGEFISLAGPSGSGKSTLLNIIGGLDRPDKGDVEVAGVKLNDLNESELSDLRLQKMGFVFQAYNLIPVLSARENVEFIMQLQNWDKKKMDERTVSLLKSVGLEDKIHNKPNQLSGGQQQRVAVARALASKPKFVLADEPTANLDSSATNQLLDIMERLNREEKITFIFATHDQRVMDKARRVITLDDGKVISDTK